MEAHTCNSSPQQAEAGGLKIQGQAELAHGDTRQDKTKQNISKELEGVGMPHTSGHTSWEVEAKVQGPPHSHVACWRPTWNT